MFCMLHRCSESALRSIAPIYHQYIPSKTDALRDLSFVVQVYQEDHLRITSYDDLPSTTAFAFRSVQGSSSAVVNSDKTPNKLAKGAI